MTTLSLCRHYKSCV